MTMLFQVPTLQINPIQLYKANREFGDLVLLSLFFGLFFRFLIHKAFLRHSGSGFHKEAKTLNALAFVLGIGVAFGILTGTKFTLAGVITDGVLQLFFGSLMGVFAYLILSNSTWGKKADSPVIAISVLVAVVFTAIFQAKTGVPGQITGWLFWIAIIFFVGWGVIRALAKGGAGREEARDDTQRAKEALIASNKRITELETQLANATAASRSENRDRQNLGSGLDMMEEIFRRLLKVLQPAAAAGAVAAAAAAPAPAAEAAVPARAAEPVRKAAAVVKNVSKGAYDVSEDYKKLANALNSLIDQLHASDYDIASLAETVKKVREAAETLKRNVEDRHLPGPIAEEVISLVEDAEGLAAFVEAAQSSAQQEDAALRPAAEHEADSLRREVADIAAICTELDEDGAVITATAKTERLPVKVVNRALINEQRLRQIMEKKKLEKPVIDELLAGFQNTTEHRKKVFADIRKKAEEIAEREAAIKRRVAAEEMTRRIETGELVKISGELLQVKDAASIILIQLGALQQFDDKLLWEWYSGSFENVYPKLHQSAVSLGQAKGDLENFVHLAKDMKAPAEQIKPAEDALTLIKILIAVVAQFNLEKIDERKRMGDDKAAIDMLKRMRKIDIEKVRRMAIKLGIQIKIEVPE